MRCRSSSVSSARGPARSDCGGQAKQQAAIARAQLQDVLRLCREPKAGKRMPERRNRPHGAMHSLQVAARPYCRRIAGARSSRASGRTQRGAVTDSGSLDRQQRAVTRKSRAERGHPPPPAGRAIAQCRLKHKVHKRTAQVAVPAKRLSAVAHRLGKQAQSRLEREQDIAAPRMENPLADLALFQFGARSRASSRCPPRVARRVAALLASRCFEASPCDARIAARTARRDR